MLRCARVSCQARTWYDTAFEGSASGCDDSGGMTLAVYLTHQLLDSMMLARLIVCAETRVAYVTSLCGLSVTPAMGSARFEGPNLAGAPGFADEKKTFQRCLMMALAKLEPSISVADWRIDWRVENRLEASAAAFVQHIAACIPAALPEHLVRQRLAPTWCRAAVVETSPPPEDEAAIARVAALAHAPRRLRQACLALVRANLAPGEPAG